MAKGLIPDPTPSTKCLNISKCITIAIGFIQSWTISAQKLLKLKKSLSRVSLKSGQDQSNILPHITFLYTLGHLDTEHLGYLIDCFNSLDRYQGRLALLCAGKYFPLVFANCFPLFSLTIYSLNYCPDFGVHFIYYTESNNNFDSNFLQLI
jgi:hypothetical protein